MCTFYWFSKADRSIDEEKLSVKERELAEKDAQVFRELFIKQVYLFIVIFIE